MLFIRHILNVMHCEKNLCENIVKTIMGMKDSPRSRQDLQDLNIRQESWLQEACRRGDLFFMPEPSYTLLPAKKAKFLSVIEKLKTPQTM
jgi:hypothetical protein